MKYSNLDIVQRVLSSMDGDEINSVSDTTESLQVLTCAETIYNDLILNADLPEQYRFYSLTDSGDLSLPLVAYRPDNYNTLEWLKYKRTIPDDTSGVLQWTLLTPILFDEFLKRQDGLNPDDDNVELMTLTVDTSNLEILYYNDRAPNWYTTYDDRTVLFNSIDASVDDTIQNSKTLCYGQLSLQFSSTDSFIPSFDSNVHQIWLHETKALASAEMRQVTNAKAEKAARKGWIKLQDMKEAINTGSYYNRLPNYGRK